MTFLQAIVIGLLQGVTELFPISSLGHSVILPALLGWNDLVDAQKAQESFFLAFLVGLHVATALALLVYFRAEWIRIVGGMIGSLRTRTVESPDARLGWLLLIATVPAGVFGVVFEHQLRVVFATPLYAAGFLVVNGLMLLLGEWLRRRRVQRTQGGGGATYATGRGGYRYAVRSGAGAPATTADRRLESLEAREALGIGIAQIGALFPGISRSGITMVAGLARGLDHEDAARFSFLLATPIILGAGLYKLPDLLGHNGQGVREQVLAGSIAAAIAAYVSVRFLTRYFRSGTLLPFAVYCLVAGGLCLVRFR
ncbi:MAG TPA: undecaprenyl-diphosphate phosphatase [Candidatus Dormibacteraeota bacterium]|nr:undecaprenyl-diphosphate phosphatase [Candidatus Dormibacteraeota bacterium]